jgi:predicted transcriptional regulator
MEPSTPEPLTGRDLAAIRRRRGGLTQAAVAKHYGASRPMIAILERATAHPRHETVLRYLRAVAAAAAERDAR